jgi:hypothetical protein
MSFIVYPKEGEPFCLEFAKFEFNGTNFVFYESRTPGARPSEHAYMSVAHVAAIVPSRTVSGRYGDERRYRVYLKGRTQTIEVVAHEFDLTGEMIVFYWLSVGSNNLERDVVENIYLAKSEVLAIFPVDGLSY